MSGVHVRAARDIRLSDLADAYLTGVRDGRAYLEGDGLRSADGYVKLFIEQTWDERKSRIDASGIVGCATSDPEVCLERGYCIDRISGQHYVNHGLFELMRTGRFVELGLEAIP